MGLCRGTGARPWNSEGLPCTGAKFIFNHVVLEEESDMEKNPANYRFLALHLYKLSVLRALRPHGEPLETTWDLSQERNMQTGQYGHLHAKYDSTALERSSVYRAITLVEQLAETSSPIFAPSRQSLSAKFPYAFVKYACNSLQRI